MKKSSKCLVLIGVVAITIGISGLFEPTNKINKNIGMQEAKAYNHNTENALDNVFIQDNNLILPFIFDSKDQAATLDIRAKFARAGLTIRNISTGTVGTGTQITVNENTNVYNILIYGDVNGDGLINLIDVQNIILHYLNQTTLTGLKATAGNVNNNDNNINLIDAQRVILFYLGNLNSGLVVKEPQASNPVDPTDPVEDSISRISITNPIKDEYIWGEEIDLTGGKINIVYTSGRVERIDMQRSMISGYNKNVLGEQLITVSYRVNITTNFTSTFKVTVKEPNKEISDIIVDKNMKSGICYQPVEFLLSSKENEKNINIDDLSFDITNGNKEDIVIEKIALEDGRIKVSFTSKTANSYVIKPKVGDKETEIKLEVKEDESINKITLVPIENNMKFEKDKSTKVEIKFSHIYPGPDGEKNGREIEVNGPDVSKVTSSLLPELDIAVLEEDTLNEIQFINKDMYLLPDTESGDTIIKYALITPKQEGNLVLSITVNDTSNNKEYTYTETIEIKANPISRIPLEIETDKDSEGNRIVRLYKSVNNINQYNDLVKQGDNNYIYTLVPIYKVDNGNTIKLKINDIYQLGYDDGKVSIEDNVIHNITQDKLNSVTDSIDIKPFKIGENGEIEIIPKPSNSDATYANSEIDYIGIALKLNEMEKGLESIIVSYENEETTLKITFID